MHRRLHVAELAVRPGQALDGDDVGAVGLDGEHQARPDRLAVDEDGARAAHAVLAAEVGAGQPEVLAQGVGERLARLDEHPPRRRRSRSAHRHLGRSCLLPSWSSTARRQASAITATPTRRR